MVPTELQRPCSVIRCLGLASVRVVRNYALDSSEFFFFPLSKFTINREICQRSISLQSAVAKRLFCFVPFHLTSSDLKVRELNRLKTKI